MKWKCFWNSAKKTNLIIDVTMSSNNLFVAILNVKNKDKIVLCKLSY